VAKAWSTDDPSRQDRTAGQYKGLGGIDGLADAGEKLPGNNDALDTPDWWLYGGP